MFNFMKRVPGGTLLIPMFISAIIHTIAPDLFRIGGMTQAVFTDEGSAAIVGVVIFCSGTGIDIRSIGKVLKKQGLLIISKLVISVIVAMLYITFFGLDGIFGINAIALVTVFASANASLYLALEDDLGSEDDRNAFGLVGLMNVPAFALLAFGISQGTSIDWAPIITTFLPLVLGMIVGNLDKNMATYLAPGTAILMPFMGWGFGQSINLIDAASAGLQGILVTVLFYITIVPLLYFIERKFIHQDGISAIAMSTVPGMSVAVPTILASSSAIYAGYAAPAIAQITMAVILTSVITPILARKLSKKN